MMNTITIESERKKRKVNGSSCHTVTIESGGAVPGPSPAVLRRSIDECPAAVCFGLPSYPVEKNETQSCGLTSRNDDEDLFEAIDKEKLLQSIDENPHASVHASPESGEGRAVPHLTQPTECAEIHRDRREDDDKWFKSLCDLVYRERDVEEDPLDTVVLHPLEKNETQSCGRTSRNDDDGDGFFKEFMNGLEADEFLCSIRDNLQASVHASPESGVAPAVSHLTQPTCAEILCNRREDDDGNRKSEANKDPPQFRVMDVLLGQGGLSNNHKGNIQFRNDAKESNKRYSNGTNADKKKINYELRMAVKNRGGRFMKKTTKAGQVQWVEEKDEAKLKKKVGEALRTLEKDEEKEK